MIFIDLIIFTRKQLVAVVEKYGNKESVPFCSVSKSINHINTFIYGNLSAFDFHKGYTIYISH
jgi:hypothetical protein